MALITRGNNMRLLRGGRVQALIMPGKPRDSVFSPTDLFTNGEQGNVHIARDLDTLISTAAGSTPDVALNGVVGKWLDQSGLGNHATQSTSTARPQLSARYNMLTATEQFNSVSWSKQAAGTGLPPTVTQNAGNDPLGAATAERAVFSRSSSGTNNRSFTQQIAAGKSSTSYTISSYIRSNTGASQRVRLYGNWGIAGAINDLIATTEWQRYSATHSTTTGTSLTCVIGFFADSFSELSSDVLLWGADMRLTADNALPYQRVVSATDYDADGFPQYLAFDADDALVSTYSSSLGSTCTVCVGRANTTPLILTGQTIGTSYTLNATVADRVTGLIVINRALTTLETSQVTDYLQALS